MQTPPRRSPSITSRWPPSDLDVALHIAAIRMQALDLSQKEWDKERGAIEQEVSRDLSNPQYVFYSQLLSALFEGTPYAHDALGTRPSFDKTTAGMLKEFHSSWYAPNNAILVIVGDVDPEATLAKVQKLFDDTPKKLCRNGLRWICRPVTARQLNLPTDLPYGLALISYRFPGFTDKDYPPARCWRTCCRADAAACMRWCRRARRYIPVSRPMHFRRRAWDLRSACSPRAGTQQRW